jgi:hypothetical protein
MFNSQTIFKHLQLITQVEQLTKCTNYNIHRKIECKYCICQYNNLFSHYHESDEKIIQNLRHEIYIHVDDDNFNGENETLFDKIPLFIMEMIFNQMDHLSLINFVKVYPKHIDLIINPKYWKYPLVDLNDKLFNRQEQFELVSYLNKNLRYLSIKEAHNINYDYLYEFFSLTPNLAYLELGKVIKFNEDICHLIVEKLSQLKFINFEWNASVFDDNCLYALHKLKFLNSIDLSHCSHLSDRAVFDFINNIEDLNHLNIDGLQDISDETIRYICNKHNKTLKSLLIDGEYNTDIAFLDLPKCTLLEYFHISFCQSLTRDLFTFMLSLNKLKLLTLRHTAEINSDAFVWLFNNAQFNQLKYLRLEKCNIDDEALAVIPKCCASIEELYLPFCWDITDLGLNEIVKNSSQLKCLDLTGIHLVSGLIFEDVPHKYLQKLEFLNLTYCRGVFNVKELFRNLINKPNTLVIDYYACPLTESSDD